ncbi:hypothetical protein [Sediminimonas qiaohouensis]|nr:hypothetical protein [Sediminimonas qiaohouensis]
MNKKSETSKDAADKLVKGISKSVAANIGQIAYLLKALWAIPKAGEQK